MTWREEARARCEAATEGPWAWDVSRIIGPGDGAELEAERAEVTRWRAAADEVGHAVVAVQGLPGPDEEHARAKAIRLVCLHLMEANHG